MFGRKKKEEGKVELTKAQEEAKTKHMLGLAYLRDMFKAEQADLIRIAAPFKRFESKATRKRHIHKHRPAGSKLMKRFDREEWYRQTGRR